MIFKEFTGIQLMKNCFNRFVVFSLITLFFLLSFNEKAFAVKKEPSGSSVKCENKAFYLKSGGYVIEFGEQTGNQILIYKPSTRGVLRLNVLGGADEFNLANTANKITCVTDNDKLAITLRAENKWGKYEITIYQYKKSPGLFRFTQQLTLKQNLPKTVETKPELQLLRRKGDKLIPVKSGDFIVGTGPRHPTYLYAKQAPFTTPVIYLCSPGWLGSTFFYFEDLTSLNKFFELSGSGAEKIMVDIDNFENTLGYTIPAQALKALPLKKKIILTDSYLYLSSQYPRDEADVALKYLSYLSTVYAYINKPATELTDWRDLAEKEIKDLNKEGLWVTVEGRPYLRAYVNDERKSAELITQLDLLLPLSKYKMVQNIDSSLIKILTNTLPAFYAERYKALNNNFPNIEEGDSWYVVEEMTQLAKLAKLGNKTAKEILLKSVKNMITFARNVDYEFPNHFSYSDFRPTFGIEQDVSGGYAYLMLELYDLFGDKKYLNEARESIKRITAKYFNLNYELQMTAMGAVAAARLYKITGEEKYLKMSYMPIANIMLVTWLWECDYGYAKSYSTFFGLSPMLHSGVITMKEQYEVWGYLTEYLHLLQGELPKPIDNLISEFYRYTLFTLKYTLPPLLPKEAAALHPTSYPEVNLNDLSIYIPLEDLREGSSKSGLIGQQVYGAGGPITFAAEAYKKINDDITVYSEYPVVWHNESSFVLSGSPEYEIWVEITGEKLPAIFDKQKQKLKVTVIDKNKLKFKARGGEKYYLGKRD